MIYSILLIILFELVLYFLSTLVLSAFVSTKSGTLIKSVVDIPNTLASYKDLQIEEQQVQAFITNRLLEIAG